jgi:hypothetical protein
MLFKRVIISLFYSSDLGRPEALSKGLEPWCPIKMGLDDDVERASLCISWLLMLFRRFSIIGLGIC